MKTLSFLLLVFVLGFPSGVGADDVAGELYLEAERRLGPGDEATYENRGVLLCLFRPAGDFILFVPVPRDISANFSRFRAYYLAKNGISIRWHKGSVQGLGPEKRYIVDETPLPGAPEAVDKKTVQIFLESLKGSKEFFSEHYF